MGKFFHSTIVFCTALLKTVAFITRELVLGLLVRRMHSQDGVVICRVFFPMFFAPILKLLYNCIGFLINVGTRDETPETSGSLLALKNTYLKTLKHTNETINYGMIQMSGGDM